MRGLNFVCSWFSSHFWEILCTNIVRFRAAKTTSSFWWCVLNGAVKRMRTSASSFLWIIQIQLAKKSYPQAWEILKNPCFAVILMDTKIVFIEKQCAKCLESPANAAFWRFVLGLWIKSRALFVGYVEISQNIEKTSISTLWINMWMMCIKFVA